MAAIAESLKLVDSIVRLRRAEQVGEVAQDVAPVRRDLESQLGPTLSRSRAARIFGVSQTALDRWVAARQIPVILTPHGRREVPRQFVIELRGAIDELLEKGVHRHVLAAALADRRNAAEEIEGVQRRPSRPHQPVPARGHDTAERRSRAYHSVVAERLDERMLEDARASIERLAGAGHIHEGYAERWRALLVRPVAEVARAISADSQDARDLRQNSPFAGVLNEQERRRIIETTR
jgi:DNA-binding transcriptional MerR regulator